MELPLKNVLDISAVRDKIRDIPDFPKKGIVFKDITPALKDPVSLNIMSRHLSIPFTNERVDVVVGIESRGFIMGSRLAADLQAGFVPVRKPNKLPSHTFTVSYDLEYGTDSLEIHTDAVNEGQRVVIHDDLMATGGSARAATELVQKMGGIIVGYSFILELTLLEGMSRLQKGVPVHSLIRV